MECNTVTTKGMVFGAMQSTVYIVQLPLSSSFHRRCRAMGFIHGRSALTASNWDWSPRRLHIFKFTPQPSHLFRWWTDYISGFSDHIPLMQEIGKKIQSSLYTWEDVCTKYWIMLSISSILFSAFRKIEREQHEFVFSRWALKMTEYISR